MRSATCSHSPRRHDASSGGPIASPRGSAFIVRRSAPGTITTRLTNADNDVIAELTEVIEPKAGSDPKTVDHRIDLPVEDLTPGEYLVTVEVSAGNDRARRDVRFRIQ